MQSNLILAASPALLASFAIRIFLPATNFSFHLATPGAASAPTRTPTRTLHLSRLCHMPPYPPAKPHATELLPCRVLIINDASLAALAAKANAKRCKTKRKRNIAEQRERGRRREKKAGRKSSTSKGCRHGQMGRGQRKSRSRQTQK